MFKINKNDFEKLVLTYFISYTKVIYLEGNKFQLTDHEDYSESLIYENIKILKENNFENPLLVKEFLMEDYYNYNFYFTYEGVRYITCIYRNNNSLENAEIIFYKIENNNKLVSLKEFKFNKIETTNEIIELIKEKSSERIKYILKDN